MDNMNLSLFDDGSPRITDQLGLYNQPPAAAAAESGSGVRGKKPFKPRKQNSPPVRSRTNYSKQHLEILENVFSTQQYPDIKRKEDIGADTGLSTHQIQTWFSNRRARERRQNSKNSASTKGTAKSNLQRHEEIFASILDQPNSSTATYPDQSWNFQPIPMIDQTPSQIQSQSLIEQEAVQPQQQQQPVPTVFDMPQQPNEQQQQPVPVFDMPQQPNEQQQQQSFARQLPELALITEDYTKMQLQSDIYGRQHLFDASAAGQQFDPNGQMAPNGVDAVWHNINNQYQAHINNDNAAHYYSTINYQQPIANNYGHNPNGFQQNHQDFLNQTFDFGSGSAGGTNTNANINVFIPPTVDPFPYID